MILPEVDLEKYKEYISINKILELYNSIIIGSRIFPAYSQTAIVNENEDNLKQSSQYFEVLFSIYKNNSKGDNNSLIYLKINEFVSSFKDMVIKLKNAGVDFKNNNSLNSIKLESNSKNSFITPPVKIEPTKQKDKWENIKEFERKEEQDFP
jgi:hypothetical protein